MKIINKISKLILSLPDKINLIDNETLLDQPVDLREPILAAGCQRQKRLLNPLVELEWK